MPNPGAGGNAVPSRSGLAFQRHSNIGARGTDLPAGEFESSVLPQGDIDIFRIVQLAGLFFSRSFHAYFGSVPFF